jgi:hypothetical protein
MAGLGNPAYSEGRIITEDELNNMSYNEILYSFLIMKVTFEFGKSVKYPSIPCFLDETTTVYPLEGEGVLTGSEYLLAKSQGCKLTISEIFYLPFEKRIVLTNDNDNEGADGNKPIPIPEPIAVNHPFKNVIHDIQNKRVEFPKGSINNLLYKEMGNSIYGAVVKGISDKRKFDIKSGRTLRMGGSELSNPILAS